MVSLRMGLPFSSCFLVSQLDPSIRPWREETLGGEGRTIRGLGRRVTEHDNDTCHRGLPTTTDAIGARESTRTSAIRGIETKAKRWNEGGRKHGMDVPRERRKTSHGERYQPTRHDTKQPKPSIPKWTSKQARGRTPTCCQKDPK